MIPFLQQPSFSVGPLTLQAFGFILAMSVVVAEALYRRRLRVLGLNVETGMSLAWYALVSGFAGAHLFSLILYFPDKLARNPLLLFKFWEDVSSFGGMLGGAVGLAIFLRTRGKSLPALVKWAYLDAIAFVVPFGWAIGRIACSLAHDHPGRITSFPLAVSLSSARAREFIARVYADAGLALPSADALSRLGFHDLGWYEFLYLALFASPLFLWLDRRSSVHPRAPGFWVATIALVYAPMRLVFDTLRVADIRYFGLTPGQYAAAAILMVPVIVRMRAPAAQGPSIEPAPPANAA
jgi:phosphatidylglycerol:prolipoprotein diacylglycerol transferase